MKRLTFFKLLALVACLLSALSANAQFYVDGIFYHLLGNNTVMVTNQNYGYIPSGYGSFYTGAVTIPSTVYYGGITYTVTGIGQYAFYNCTGLTSVTLPSTITFIDNSAFSSNSSNSPNFTSITIPNGVKTIGDYAFAYCNFTSINIPNNVETIGEYAFKGCDLQTVTLGFSVQSIGNYAFTDANNAQVYCYAYFPPTIYSETFSHYSGPHTINGYLYTLSGCYSDYCSATYWSTFYSKNTISGSTAYDAKFGDFYSQFAPRFSDDINIARVTNNGNYNCYPNTSYTVPSAVTWRGESFPVRQILSDAFRGSTSIKTVDLSNATNIYAIGTYAFYGCTSLWKVSLPPSLYTSSSTNSIKDYAFSNTGLTDLYTNSSTPPTISSTAFNGRYTRCTVYVPYPRDIATYQAAQYWSNFYATASAQCYDFYKNGIYYRITGSNTVEVTTADAINRCSYTGSVSVPSSVTWNGTTYNVTAVGEWAFSEAMPMNLGASPKGYSPGSLKSVTLPNSVTTIKSNAFNSCSGLTSVTLGTGVTSIGSDAFNYCISLKTVNISRTTPPTIQSGTFNASHYSTVIVRVPSSAVSSYKAATYWKNFYMILPNNVTELNYALNVSGGSMSFTSTGDYPWTVTSDGTRIYAQSGNAGVASSTSTLTSSVSLSKANTLTFDFKAWGEGTNYDVCIFSIDGVEQFKYGSRDNDWETYTANIPAGTHTLTWTYQKDGSVNPSGDYFAVDNVKLTEINVQTGDLDGDGNVNIADVTALIDLLLSGATAPAVADCNHDGQVNIADVTALIDYLLSGSW